MKRVFYLLAALLAVGCSNRERSYEGSQSSYGTSSAPTAATQGTTSQGTTVRPSDLSPEQVRLIQRSLVDRGFAVDLTGTFDDHTRTALVDFQRARGLSATGDLDSSTIQALGIDPRQVTPVRGGADQSGATMNPSPSATPSTPSTPNMPDASKEPSSPDTRDTTRSPDSARPPDTQRQPEERPTMPRSGGSTY